MKERIVGILAILATFAILAYTVFAANQNAVDNSKACEHASYNGKSHASDNSVLSSCATSVCGNGICESGEDSVNCEVDCPIG